MPRRPPQSLPQASLAPTSAASLLPDGGTAVLPSGWEALDRLLGGGWPGGVLTEVIGRGRCSIALAAVRQAQDAGQPVAWVDGPGSFCPPTAGVDLSRLALVRPPRGRPGVRGEVRAGARAEAPCWLAADLLLRSRAFGLLVLDLPPCRSSLAACFRLARQAAAARSVLMLLSGAQTGVAGSAAGVLVHVRQRHSDWQRRMLPPAPALELTLQRHRGAAPGARVVL